MEQAEYCAISPPRVTCGYNVWAPMFPIDVQICTEFRGSRNTEIRHANAKQDVYFIIYLRYDVNPLLDCQEFCSF